MTERELLALEDFAFLVEMGKCAEHEITHVRIGMEYLSGQIESLRSEAALPARLRAAYAEVQDDLLEIMKLAKQKEREYCRLARWNDLRPEQELPYPSDATIDSVRHAIERINAVERQLSGELKDLRERLGDAKRPLKGWNDGNIDLTIVLELEPSAERSCYQNPTVPLYFKLRWSAGQDLTHAHLLGDGENWNKYRNSDHPFRNLHIGYLAYSLLNRTFVPWRLFGRLRTIEALIDIRAAQTFRVLTEHSI